LGRKKYSVHLVIQSKKPYYQNSFYAWSNAMKIIVLNGSPKGEHSITFQYVHFLQKKFPQHELKTINVSQKIKKIENDEKAFMEIIEEVRSSDGVLWSFGLWVLVVAAQYIRFIELISERGVEDAFRDKYTAALSTSIHFYDHTAHNYIRAVCEDLEMKYVDGLSFDILDLMKKSERETLVVFAENLFEAIEKKTVTSRLFRPMTFSDFIYEPSAPEEKISNDGRKVAVLTDAYNKDSNLGKMIDRFTASFENGTEWIDLSDIDIQGACLGCMRCGYDYRCVQKDGFSDFYNNRVRTADIIVFAGTVKGRYLSSKWKTFFDRAFFWNHTPSLAGKQIGYIISGPLSQNQNLIQILEASSIARQHAGHVDIISDECENSSKIDGQLQSLAERLIRFSKKGYIKPQNFLGVGGHKVFRDDIWGRLRPIWQADHRYYRSHGLYDFPQRDIKIRIFRPIMMLLTKIPKFRKGFYGGVKTFPAKRYSRLIENIK
jgi:multimeric flavodoxin WrbA